MKYIQIANNTEDVKLATVLFYNNLIIINVPNVNNLNFNVLFLAVILYLIYFQNEFPVLQSVFE